MTDPKEAPVRLWTPDGFCDDGFRHVENLDDIGGNEGVILSVDAFVSLSDEEREKAKGRIGVILNPADNVDLIVPYLGSVALVALSFPAFGDGRSFSKAELLRTRHGYKGPLRATGDVLIDQLPLMIRTGFTQFEVSNPTTLARLEAGNPGGLALHYQPTAKPAEKTGGFAWRRRTST